MAVDALLLIQASGQRRLPALIDLDMSWGHGDHFGELLVSRMQREIEVALYDARLIAAGGL